MKQNYAKKATPDEGARKYLTRRSLAQRWDCSVDTIRRIEKSGNLNPIVLPGTRKVVYAIAEVEELESQAA